MSHFILKQEQNYNTFTVPCEKSKTFSLASSIMKNIVDRFSRFPANLIFCVSFGSASSACFYLNLLLSSYNSFWNKYSPAMNQLWSSLWPVAIFWILSYVIELVIIGWSKKFYPSIITL